jgi:phage/plasmid-associated DNA primase
MDLIERIPLRPIKWLSQLSLDEFSKTCLNPNKKHTKEDVKAKYSAFEQFCNFNIKTNGQMKRLYKYSIHTPYGLGGRLFCGGSIQGLPSRIRGLLMRDITTDVDMVCCHNVILRYICKKHNISCPNLEYYINHRDECLSKFETREVGKKAYLKATNNDKLNPSIKIPEFKNYDKEMKLIQKSLIQIPEYQQLVDSVPDTKLYNHDGSAINRILCYYENMILQHAISVINNRGIEIAVLMFDGFMIYGDYYKNKRLLEEITNYVEKQMPSLQMVWAYKEHSLDLNVPDDFDESIEYEKPEFVCNDLDAAKKLYSLYSHWKYCRGELYVFDDTCGIWKTDRNLFNEIASRFTNKLWLGVKNKGNTYEASKIKSYGNTTTLFNQMLEKLKILCIDDYWLKTLGTSSRGKLLFKNGYFDMRENNFYNEFNPNILFSGKINYDYQPNTDEEYMESIKKRLFYDPLGKEVGDFFILNLARGLAGDVMKRILFGLGYSNTGKSTITKAFLNACSDYVGTFDGNSFAYRNTGSDMASQNRWMMLLKDKRIIFSNEVKSTIPLNGNLMKVVSSGGDAVVGRKHCGNEEEFYLSFLCVMFANDLPKIIPYDNAINNRVRVVSYEKTYSENPQNEFELLMDKNIDKEIETLEFQREFLEILIRQYWMGRNGLFKDEPVEVIKAKEEWIGTEVGCISSFIQEFEITNNENDFVLSSEIQEWLEHGKYGITMKKFGMEIKQYTKIKRLNNITSNLRFINGKNTRIWSGIKYSL